MGVFADELRYEFALVHWSLRFHFFAFSPQLYKPAPIYRFPSSHHQKAQKPAAAISRVVIV
jgi:hypothetical protein